MTGAQTCALPIYTTQQSPRDNVLLEFGLFTGALGRDRVWMLVDSDRPTKIASDLGGITQIRYASVRSDDNIQAAVGPACVQIKEAVKKWVK